MDIQKKIKSTIESNDVVLFMKGDRYQPLCGFSKFVVDILNHLDVKYLDINVLEDNDIREGIKKYSDWPTIPQLYVHTKFIGGCDIVKEMYESGQLGDLFQ